MNAIRRIAKAVFHQSLIAQGVTAISALVCVAFLARGLSTNDYANYAVVTAIWAIGNAVVGTGTGTRVAKAAAEGAERITFQPSELCIAAAAGVGTAAYVAFVRSSFLEGCIAGACMLSFIFAEAGTAFEVGAGRFNRYLIILGIRALLPPAILSSLAFTDTLSFLTATASVLAGNLISLLPWPQRWSLQFNHSSQLTGHAVGAINMGLWVIASADRLVLERTISAAELASYALVYGLADRVYRSLSNAYIAKSLGRAFQGYFRLPSWKFYALTVILAAGLVPTLQVGSAVLSNGRYESPFLMTVAISIAGLCMIWSAPFYVRLMAAENYTKSLVVVFTLALLNVAANILLSGLYGSVAAAIISALTYLLWFTWLFLLAIQKPPRSLDGARHARSLQSLRS